MVLRLIADRSTGIFHDYQSQGKPCSEADKIDLKDTAYFETRVEAEAADFKPCPKCFSGVFDQSD